MNSSSIDLGNSISFWALRARWSKFRFSLRAGITAPLLVIALLLAVRAVLYAQTSDLTGTYLLDNVQVRAPVTSEQSPRAGAGRVRQYRCGSLQLYLTTK